MPPAVGQQLVDLDRPGGHVEDVLGRLTLVEQRLARPQLEGGDDGRHVGDLLIVEGGAEGQVADVARITGRRRVSWPRPRARQVARHLLDLKRRHDFRALRWGLLIVA